MEHNMDAGHCLMEFKRNSLNLIRLLAAFEVFYVHAALHMGVGLSRKLDLMGFLFPGVPLFFILSGYLIRVSIDHTPDFKTFVKKRILRLYPELWMSVAMSLAAIFTLYDGVVWRDLATFALTQSTVLQFWTPDSLRGYGCGVPNGALWTICVMVQFYFAAWFLWRKPSRLVCGVLMAVSLLVNILSGKLETVLPVLMYKLLFVSLVPYLWLFFLGAFLSANFRRIMPWLARFWWVPLLVLLLQYKVRWDVYGYYPVLNSILTGFTWLGFAYAFPKLDIKHDISYGIYVYHMVFVNIAIALGHTGSGKAVVSVMVITVLVAIGSYASIGRCFWGRKHRLGGIK